MDAFSTADLALARRIEATEAASGFRFIQAFQETRPDLNAAAEPFLGGCAAFAGVGSPATHALGIGMTGPATAEELDRMEAFFRERGSPVLIDLCPMADMSLLQLIFARGYRVIEFNNLMLRRIQPDETFPEPPTGLGIGLAEDAQAALWSRTVTRGFQERDDVDDAFVDIVGSLAWFGHPYLAWIAEQPVGGAGLSIHGATAYLHGDSTVLAARGRGVQQALIHARLAHAAHAGCDLAMACVLPGSGSHRNYERAGFQLFFMRVNLSLP